MATTKTLNRRRQLVVNRPMQGRLILSMALAPALLLTALAVFTAIYCTWVMDEALATDADVPNTMPLFYLVLGFELLGGFFLLFHSLRASHRVAGPAYRICKSLERIRSGDLAFTVNLRKGDHLTEVRDELNRLLDWLNDNPPPGCVTRTMQAHSAEGGATKSAPGGSADGTAKARELTTATTSGR